MVRFSSVLALLTLCAAASTPILPADYAPLGLLPADLAAFDGALTSAGSDRQRFAEAVRSFKAADELFRLRNRAPIVDDLGRLGGAEADAARRSIVERFERFPSSSFYYLMALSRLGREDQTAVCRRLIELDALREAWRGGIVEGIEELNLPPEKAAQVIAAIKPIFADLSLLAPAAAHLGAWMREATPQERLILQGVLDYIQRENNRAADALAEAARRSLEAGEFARLKLLVLKRVRPGPTVRE